MNDRLFGTSASPVSARRSFCLIHPAGHARVCQSTHGSVLSANIYAANLDASGEGLSGTGSGESAIYHEFDCRRWGPCPLTHVRSLPEQPEIVRQHSERSWLTIRDGLVGVLTIHATLEQAFDEDITDKSSKRASRHTSRRSSAAGASIQPATEPASPHCIRTLNDDLDLSHSKQRLQRRRRTHLALTALQLDAHIFCGSRYHISAAAAFAAANLRVAISFSSAAPQLSLLWSTATRSPQNPCASVCWHSTSLTTPGKNANNFAHSALRSSTDHRMVRPWRSS